MITTAHSIPAVWNNYSADEKAAIGLTWEDEVAAHDNRLLLGAETLMAVWNCPSHSLIHCGLMKMARL